MHHIQSSMNFLKRDNRYETEKPYTFRNSGKGLDIPPTNVENELCNIVVHDLRGQEDAFSIESNGFEIMKMKTKLSYEDFDDPAKINIYLHELEELLKARLGADHVKVFRHGIRKRHAEFPISIGKNYDHDQPTSVAHVDTTPSEALEEVRRQYKDQADFMLRKRIQWINVWKPLRGPLNDWPLAVCDNSDVAPNDDFEYMDLLYQDLITENCLIYYNPKHRWYFLSNHDPSELVVFLQADTKTSFGSGVPHSAFPNPLTPTDEAPRESIEARALLFYDEI